MANLNGVRESLANRVLWVLDESSRRTSQRFVVDSGFRPPQEQLSIWYDRMTTVVLPNRPSAFWNGKRWYLKPGMALVAPPGTSDHEHEDAQGNPDAKAVDVGCLTRDNPTRIVLFKEAGLSTVVPGEPWHVTERAGGAIPLSKKVLKSMTDSPYISVPCPTGGFWRVEKSNGGVGALSGAPFFGSLPSVGAKVVADIVGLTPCVRGGVVIGYWVFDVDGHLYAFGDAPYFTDYASHPEWHSPNSLIDGLVQTKGFAKGEQIRYCFLRYEVGDAEYIPDTYDIGREFLK